MTVVGMLLLPNQLDEATAIQHSAGTMRSMPHWWWTDERGMAR
jgi:hypothetical protein